MKAAQEHMKPSKGHTLAEAMHGQPALQADAEWDRLSALLDDELASGELDVALAEFAAHSEGRSSWHAYQVIGDVLRASGPAVTACAPQVFLAGIHTRLQAEQMPETFSAERPSVWPAEPPSAAGTDRSVAANDAVFRWKLLAGVASLAAVMAVSWTVLGSAPGGAGGGGGAGPQLALTSPSAPMAGVTTDAARMAAAQPAPGALVINTAQGPLVRDAQLEALMAEHRQFGGVSALQMPAGFLRNATYDAPAR